jgi:Fe2+ transport system protein FeoA
MQRPPLPLTKLPPKQSGCIRELKLPEAYMRRVAPMGLSTGCRIRIIRNSGKRALIIKAMHTYLALSRTLARNIFVEETR